MSAADCPDTQLAAAGSPCLASLCAPLARCLWGTAVPGGLGSQSKGSQRPSGRASVTYLSHSRTALHPILLVRPVSEVGPDPLAGDLYPHFSRRSRHSILGCLYHKDFIGWCCHILRLNSQSDLMNVKI